MVFESIVADLLNRFLGDYVQNLDRSQLQIGIFGGDVVLQDLVLKQSALDELDLPVKTVYGHLGKLVLKIPWRNLYSAPVEASIERLYLLVVPNTEVKYDAEKEEKWQQEAKQAELQRVEEAKRQEKEKDKPKTSSTFAEKLATQIIKNVQVKIQSIHIRYEDKITNPGSPFSLGITLHNLSVHTTDENWKACIVQDESAMIHKVLELECLAAYWNCHTQFFESSGDPKLLHQKFQSTICSKEKRPNDYAYFFGPINSSAKLRINPKPETDGSNFTIPKLLLDLCLEKLSIGLSKEQYHNILELVESFDRMNKAAPYRKYRPNFTSYHGHYKEWWKFAYTCILEEEVRRKRQNWNWEHIHNHRNLCRRYAKSYQEKLTKSKLPTETVAAIQECEKKLDLFNIVLLRKRIEVEVERLGRAQELAKQKGGWFSGLKWWSSEQKSNEEALSAAAIVKKFEDAMTPEEKAKLFKAIDYQENATPAQYPPEFVEMSASLSLGCLQVEIRDEAYSCPKILETDLEGVGVNIQRRPAAQAIRFEVQMQKFTVFGMEQGSHKPKLISSKYVTKDKAVLLDVLFETNPLDDSCDQLLQISSCSLQIVYDADTINKLADVFRPPAESQAISQIQAAAGSRLADLKEMSAIGLQHAIEQHKSLKLHINLLASYIILPYSGRYTRQEDVVVVNLGSFNMQSIVDHQSGKENVRSLFAKGTTEEEILEVMRSQSYERYIIELKQIQVLFAMNGEPWQDALLLEDCSPMHLLLPTSLIVSLNKCLITDDPNLPKIKVMAQLPNVAIAITDKRILRLMALLSSIPFPEDASGAPLKDSGSRSSSVSRLSHYLDLASETNKPKTKPREQKQDSDIVQSVELEMNFEMRDLFITMYRQNDDNEESVKVFDFCLLRLELEMIKQTFDMTVALRLGGLSCDVMDPVSGVIRMLDTPMAAGELEYLLTVKFVNVDRLSPELHSKHNSVLQLLLINFSQLTVYLHQEVIIALIAYSQKLMNDLQKVQNESSNKGSKLVDAGNLATIPEDSEVQIQIFEKRISKGKKSRKGAPIIETIDFRVGANLKNFEIKIVNRTQSLAEIIVAGIDANITVKKSYTEVIARLKDILVKDLNPETCHPKILSVLADEALSLQLVMFNLDEKNSNDKVNMSVTVSMACVRVVFLNLFVSSILNFLNSFQEAQERIINAAYDAAEAAKQNVQHAYSEAVRIKLDIDLKAPLIVVPTNSQSMDTIHLDFGQLTIKNKFSVINSDNEGRVAVIDEIHVGLANLKMARVKLDLYSGHSVAECLLLHPISLIILVKRNLSSPWYNLMPDIDILGRLETVKIILSQEDFAMIMKVQTENLSRENEKIVSESISQTKKIDWKDESLMKQLDSTESSAASSRRSVDKNVTTFLKFTFTMENLIVDLFKGGSKMLEGAQSPLRSPDLGLARFTLHVLSLKGQMLSDNSLAVSILLVDCLWDDTRHGRENKLNRLMERKQAFSRNSVDSDSQFRSMVDITYQQKGDDSFVDMKIFGFNFILSLDYILKVSDFFVSGKPQQKDTIKEPPAHRYSTQKQSMSKSVSKSVSSAQKEKGGMMTVNIHVEKPDIILVEKMDDIDTNAIILNNEIWFKLRMSSEHQVMTGSIKDLELYSCCYNPQKRLQTMAQILRPCTITLAGSTPEGEGLHFDLSVTDIHISVSPATIELLSGIQRAFTAPEATEDVSDIVEEDFSAIWAARPLEDKDYWYFKTEMGVDALSNLEDVKSEIAGSPKKEICIVQTPKLVITVEAGVGNQTLPMILLELSFQGKVRNWSSQLQLESSMSLQMAYYNSYLALWEPLIEPVETIKDGKTTQSLWELQAEVHMNKIEPLNSPGSITDDLEDIPYQPPAMVIDIISKENLELTMSKTCLEVLTNLGKAFQTAIKEGLSVKSGPLAPYTVCNDTGMTVTLLLRDSHFKILDSDRFDNYQQVLLESGARAGLNIVSSEPSITGHLSIKSLRTNIGTETSLEKTLRIKIRILDKDCILNIPVVRADKRYFSLQHRGESNDQWGLVSSVTVDDGGIIVTLRSIIQVHNHFSEPVDVYYMTRRGNELERIGTVNTGQALNLPLYSVYTPTNELFFSVKGYTVSVVPFIWKELQNLLNTTKVLQCDSKDSKDKDPFFMKIVGEMEQVYFENTTRHTMASTCYNIHLRPAVLLKNFLPIEIIVCLANTARETQLDPGHRTQVATAEPGSSTIIIRIPQYLEKEWVCKHEVQTNPPNFSVWTFDSYDSIQKMSLDLGMYTVHKNGSLVMTLYCPFWMLNKTGMMLSYRKSRRTEKNESAGSPLKQSDESTNVLYHPDYFKGPILFSFRAKSFFGKKKASIKIEDGEWSDKFSLDVAGSSGTINCKYNNIIYQIGVQIQLTYSGLTKQVIFTPYHVLINNSDFIVECQEDGRDADPWTKVQPESCTALWPRSLISEGDRKLRVRISGSSGITEAFSIDTVHTTLLKLNNKYGGVNVDVQVTEGAVYIKFTSYKPGLAPALILNHSTENITFLEKGGKTSRTLKPKEQIMFTWENPTGPRQLLWWNASKKKEVSDDLRKDGIDKMVATHGGDLWWVSFLDGMQRVVLFTEDAVVATLCQAAGELEPFDTEIRLSVHGVGLSLVNNVNHTELMYLGIASSGVVWETCKHGGRRFKPLSVRECFSIEQAYQRYMQEILVQQPNLQNRVIIDKLEIDFKTEEVLRPYQKRLRRTYHTGLWVQLKQSAHQLQLHAKVNRLQIDNQMFDCVFPVVFAPVPPPKSVAADSAIKPFAELSIVRRYMEHSPVQQYKYFKILIQEFHVKLDMGFVNGLMQMFMADEVTDAQEAEQFTEDLKLADKPLLSHVTLQSYEEQKNFYDLLHFSPLKIHLSFSLSGGDTAVNANQQTPLFLNVLLQSLGVTLTDMQDVVFKLAYFEREYSFLTQKQLISEVTMHYVGQSLKQLYVLVLGLDVLGNPYGLVLGLTQGVEDLFYEPFQGAIQGPGEFAEGIVLGVRSLFGHTVGGAAGAMSRITGAMGKGIAALTFDKDYQRKRREAMHNRPSTVPTGLAQSGKGLVMGVVDGVTGVFTKPISGAREEGVEGFFKGMGKGVVGLVTRPAAGVIDFASGSLDAVKRAAELGDEVMRLRPPRFFRQDGLLRPYARFEAEGNKLLQELEKNKYATTDIYVAHIIIAKDILLLTDKRIMYVVHNDIFGGWQVDWGYTWDALSQPRIVDKGIFITTGESKKKVLGIFGSNESGKVILVKDPEQKVWLLQQMENQMKK